MKQNQQMQKEKKNKKKKKEKKKSAVRWSKMFILVKELSC